MLLYLFLFGLTTVAADDCFSCLGGILRTWCFESSKCSFLLPELGCKTVISDPFNCPTTPAVGFEYNDTFARSFALPYISAAYGGSYGTSKLCLTNNVPSTTFDKYITVNCSQIGLDTTCTAYTAYDTTNKAIIVSFTGTIGIIQLGAEFFSVLAPMRPFYNHGYVFRYFYDSFDFLWNGGLQAAVNALKTTYPDYDLWVFGHSLGAAEASILASYALENNLFPADRIRLMTFGQPRTGNKDFAQWHEDNLPYSYRVIHKNDLIAQLPPFSGDLGYWHHRYGVWYNNDMTTGSNYTLCTTGDGHGLCNNGKGIASWDDHNVYFNVNISAWAAQGCPVV